MESSKIYIMVRKSKIKVMIKFDEPKKADEKAKTQAAKTEAK